MRNIFTKIVLFILLLVLISSCDATKRIPESEHLLEKNTIIVNDKKTSSLELHSFLKQRPNEKVAGIPFSLHLYSLGNPNYTVPFRQNPKKEKKLTSIFSEKQVIALEKSYLGINNWFLRSGNKPVISDIKKVKKSAEALQNYYFNNGFWDATVSYNEKKEKNKRIAIDYLVTTRDPYFLDTISTNIASPVLDSLYKKNSEASFIKQGDQFKVANFEKEENRLIKLYRNSGVYRFGKNNITFDVDTTNIALHKQNIQLKIRDRIVEENDSVYAEPFQIQKVKKVNVFTDFSFSTKNEKSQDSATYNGINFYAIDKLKYNPKYLANAIIIQPDSIYKDSERDLTRKYLRELQNFRPSIDIRYQENEDESLTANIYLTPLKEYSLGWDAEFTTSNIKPFGILGKFSFLNRNIFKGAEILELFFQGSFLNTSLDNNNSAFLGLNAWEIGTGATLKTPRILFPFKTTGVIPKRMSPKTNIGLSIGLQRNIGLDRQNITSGIDYTWQSKSTTNHKFELLNVQYIRNTNPKNYFSIYISESEKLNDISSGESFNNIIPLLENSSTAIINGIERVIPRSYVDYIDYVLDPSENFQNMNPEEYKIVSNVKQQREILVENVLVPVISYAYNYNNRESIRDASFSTFTGRLISSGSITSLFVKETAESGKKELFGLPVAQYIKTELEHKKYWAINLNSTLVLRNFIGIAVPFGNSDDIPFSRSYRAGGSNDIRAWQTFDLGPGTEVSGLEFNTGNLKLTSNLEYRFKVINSLKGALFIDAGNIWDVSNSPLSSPEAKFKGFNSIKTIAVGSGIGARYDFGFLIFRVDAGFKTYEPYLKSSNKWFQHYNFKNEIYNIGINYPF